MKETISPGTSRKIKNMGLVCSILVVAMHVCWPSDVPLTPGWFARQGLADGLGRMAVPFFFVVSGFFLARHFGEQGWWRREICKRLKSLGPPYVAWSLAALLVPVVLSAVFDLGAHRPFGSKFQIPPGHDWMAVFGLDLSKLPLNGTLWYVRCLFALAAVSSVLERIVARFARTWLAAAFLLLLFCWHVPAGKWAVCLYHVSQGLFYFSVGIVLRRKGPPGWPSWTAVFSGLAGLALLSAGIAAAWKGWPWAYEWKALSVPFLLHGAWSVVPSSKWPDWLTSCAFPIFLMHPLVVRFLEPFLLAVGMGRFPAALAEWMAGVACPCALAWFIRRHAPRLAFVLFGGR